LTHRVNVDHQPRARERSALPPIGHEGEDGAHREHGKTDAEAETTRYCQDSYDGFHRVALR